MSQNKQFVFLDTGQASASDLPARLQAALEAKGAQVETMALADGYDAVLDRIEQGAVPVVLKA